jgi:hypothetical protein
MSTNLIIKSHHPWRHRLKIAGVVGLLLVIAWLLVDFGRYRTESAAVTLGEERDRLQDALDDVQDENKELKDRIAVLERAAQVDRQAYGEVERTLEATQNEMLELKEELAFYRGILMPAETSAGLNVADFRLTAIGEKRAYRYKLVLTQVAGNDRLVQGTAQISFEGLQKNGGQVQVGLRELTKGAQDRLAVRFKYFQHFEGEVVLPEGFVPSRVLVDVLPSGGSLLEVKKTFDWSNIVK